MTIDEIAKAINTVFLSSQADFETTLTIMSKQAALRQVEIQLDQLNLKRTEILKPLEDVRIDLTNQRQALLVALSPK